MSNFLILTTIKKLLFLLIAVMTLASCKVKNTPDEPFIIDPSATVNIKPDMKGWAKSPAQRVKAENPLHLSPLEIVEQTTVVQYYNPNVMQGAEKWERTFDDELQRDLNPENPMLKMYATDIINDKGELVIDFVEGYNTILLHFDLKKSQAPRDTIGYIPNSTLRTAEIAIKKAFLDKDYDAVYELFHNAYKFLPITGSEYKALKEARNQ